MRDVSEIETLDRLDAIEECDRRGWADGLPVVPPTEDRVDALLRVVDLPAEAIVAKLPMRDRTVTAARAAANSVMAGCRPEYFPVVLAVLDALMKRADVVHEISGATNAPGLLILVNGPARERLGVNCRGNLLSPGVRANMTIARAIRLIFMNVFEARPGRLDRGTLGESCKHGLCFGEDEEASPWTPLHTDLGFASTDSTVMVASVQSPQLANSRFGHTGESILLNFADVMANSGIANMWARSQWWVVIGPEHRAMLQRDGWTKPAIKAFLAERARRSLADLKRMGVARGAPEAGDEERRVHAAAAPEDIFVVAAGGEGGAYSAIIKGYTGFRAVTKKIEETR